MHEGFVVVNKPAGLTSFGVVRKLRRVLGVKKIGHAGTLDPFATGVLVLAVGRLYTRQIDQIQAQSKWYQARFVWGVSTDTLDPEGRIESCNNSANDQSNWVRFRNDLLYQSTILEKLTGPLMQVPPRFSAKKINGSPMYTLARQGHIFDIQPVSVHVFSWSVLRTGDRFVDVEIQCSKGTYIRSLARDLGRLLGGPMYAQLLTRTAVGEYKLTCAIPLELVSASHVVASR